MSIFINNLVVPTFLFSGGECSVKLDPAVITAETQLVANLYNSNDVMTLMLTVDAIRRINANTRIHLTIPYFPYARQDRVCNVGESLSVKVMADLINALHCQQVTIYDPHSDVTPALLNNCKTVSLAELIMHSDLKNIIHEKCLTLLSPDAGAEKKVSATAKLLSSPTTPIHFMCASKVRDTLTGNIVSSNIHDNVESLNIIILDDICDGGRTFIELAKILKNNGANDIYLYVIHGIFSKGLEELKQYFKHVYCHHAFLRTEQIEPSFLTILNENQFRGAYVY
jgi:ribose-phosphate pyrophosphokinase